MALITGEMITDGSITAEKLGYNIISLSHLDDDVMGALFGCKHIIRGDFNNTDIIQSNDTTHPISVNFAPRLFVFFPKNYQSNGISNSAQNISYLCANVWIDDFWRRCDDVGTLASSKSLFLKGNQVRVATGSSSWTPAYDTNTGITTFLWQSTSNEYVIPVINGGWEFYCMGD